MLKQLSIKNFKSHKDTTLNFSKGVNVIVGQSQAGKTNVLRALLLLSRNRPVGGGYFSNFAGQKGTTQVSAALDNDAEVVLAKDIQINKKGEKIVTNQSYIYILRKHPYEDFYFEGFGASVPDQVEEALNLSELNIQEQFDTPFLVMASAGEIARTINRITKLEKVDQWVSKLTTRINNNNAESKLLEKQIEEVKEETKKYKNIDKAEQCVNAVVSLTKKVNYLKSREAKIKETTRELIKTNEKIEEIQEALKVEKIVEKVEAIDSKISRAIVVENKLIELVDLEKWITKCNKTFEKLKPVNKEIKKISQSIMDKIDLSCSLNQYLKANQDCLSTEKEYKETKKEYLTLCRKVGKCPICWNKIDEQCIERIEKEM